MYPEAIASEPLYFWVHLVFWHPRQLSWQWRDRKAKERRYISHTQKQNQETTKNYKTHTETILYSCQKNPSIDKPEPKGGYRVWKVDKYRSNLKEISWMGTQVWSDGVLLTNCSTGSPVTLLTPWSVSIGVSDSNLIVSIKNQCQLIHISFPHIKIDMSKHGNHVLWKIPSCQDITPVSTCLSLNFKLPYSTSRFNSVLFIHLTWASALFGL